MRFSLEQFSEVLRLRDATGRPYILIGGQAINYWAERYLAAEPALRRLQPFTSLDIDFRGNREDVQHIAAQLNTTPVYPPKVAITALVGAVPVWIGGIKSNVEVVRRVPGVSPTAIEALAIEAEWAGRQIRAQHKLVAGDGAPWIWNVAQDRWAEATQVLDFYHASQHLWELGRALHCADETATARWVEPRRHQLRHGREKQVLTEIARLQGPPGEAGAVIRREQNYFASQTERLHYRKWSRRGWPIASGPVESACRQKQCRFKRPGQFWTAKGMRHLGALTEARHNHHWDELWLSS